MTGRWVDTGRTKFRLWPFGWRPVYRWVPIDEQKALLRKMAAEQRQRRVEPGESVSLAPGSYVARRNFDGSVTVIGPHGVASSP